MGNEDECSNYSVWGSTPVSGTSTTGRVLSLQGVFQPECWSNHPHLVIDGNNYVSLWANLGAGVGFGGVGKRFLANSFGINKGCKYIDCPDKHKCPLKINHTYNNPPVTSRFIY